ncbi:MAG: methionine gamma-lyase family protein [Oscillospiraceae bacterium]|nr:methionine gamma-lyase family protein [Oscillospiraceae bacterium]
MLFERYGISKEFCALDERLIEKCRDQFDACERVRDAVQLKVLDSFIKNKVGLQHLVQSTGYGYGDAGRDTFDRLFADCVGAEDAICRPHMLSGTHALTVALFGLLRTGDRLLAVTGRPYDTLQPVIGLTGTGYGSLREFGVDYDEVSLVGGEPDLEEIARKSPSASVVHIQRSRGYEARRAFSPNDIRKICETVKKANPETVILVDNCYGEFTETEEPVSAGADLIAGSLIKNPGGAIAPTGGYIAGRADLVERCAHRLTSPGTGRELGSNPGGMREYYLGLYFAPQITCEAKKTSIYAAALFEEIGYDAVPAYDMPRNDIITSVVTGSPENLIALCEEIQASSPVDSFASPVPDDMPGYDDKVIMAAGTFTQGSSIELSCDGPMREPYVAYIQGGINLTSSRLALLRAAMRMKR